MSKLIKEQKDVKGNDGLRPEGTQRMKEENCCFTPTFTSQKLFFFFFLQKRYQFFDYTKLFFMYDSGIKLNKKKFSRWRYLDCIDFYFLIILNKDVAYNQYPHATLFASVSLFQYGRPSVHCIMTSYPGDVFPSRLNGALLKSLAISSCF